MSAVAFDDAFQFCAEKRTADSTDGGSDEALAALRSRAPLVGLDFQREIERAAAAMGGGDLVVPVQTAPDFLAGRLSDVASLPKSSYRLGVRPARLDLLYPEAITDAVRESLRAFDAQMPGYAGPEALLHAPEARTSSPVRVVRDGRDGSPSPPPACSRRARARVRGRDRLRRGGRSKPRTRWSRRERRRCARSRHERERWTRGRTAVAGAVSSV